MLLVAHRTPLSRVGCQRLAAAGATVFEIDVQVDEHDRIVVSHFMPVGRSRLLQHDNWRFRWHTAAARDPRLIDVAATVPDDCVVLLDLKDTDADRRARLVAAIVDGLPERSRFRVCGPRRDDLDALREAGFPTWRTVGDRRELSAVLDEGALPDEAVTIRHSLLTPTVVERLHGAVAEVIAWTVNDVDRARTLRAWGVTGVTTDRTAVLEDLSGSPH